MSLILQVGKTRYLACRLTSVASLFDVSYYRWWVMSDKTLLNSLTFLNTTCSHGNMFPGVSYSVITPKTGGFASKFQSLAGWFNILINPPRFMAGQPTARKLRPLWRETLGRGDGYLSRGWLTRHNRCLDGQLKTWQLTRQDELTFLLHQSHDLKLNGQILTYIYIYRIYIYTQYI